MKSVDVPCPKCGARTGEYCKRGWSCRVRFATLRAIQRTPWLPTVKDKDQMSTEYVYRASDFENFDPSEPHVAEPEPLPTCDCGQQVSFRHLAVMGRPCCGDCYGTWERELGQEHLDARVRDAQRDVDPTSDWSAWAHPSSEGP